MNWTIEITSGYNCKQEDVLEFYERKSRDFKDF
jgi:hypothetical protein